MNKTTKNVAPIHGSGSLQDYFLKLEFTAIVRLIPYICDCYDKESSRIF